MFFYKKIRKNGKKVMKFLTGLCQDDVTTSSDDVISRKELYSHVQEKILGKVTKGILKIGYGSGVTQQKVGLGVNLPPLVLCVLIAYSTFEKLVQLKRALLPVHGWWTPPIGGGQWRRGNCLLLNFPIDNDFTSCIASLKNKMIQISNPLPQACFRSPKMF